jgi:hypothetical protein
VHANFNILLNPALAREMLDLTLNQHADLDRWGAQPDYERALARLVEQVIAQAEGASPT